MLNFSLFSRKKDMVKSLQELIKIKSVKDTPKPNMPYGKGIADAMMYATNLAESMDFDSVNMYSNISYIEYGEGEEEFAILVHLDVVPEGEGWTKPAFEGVYEDGKVYGRGAIDNKGPFIAALYALDAIKENCINLNKKVKIIIGCDEESGWSDIDFYKKNVGKMPDMAISPDGEFPIINFEKGLAQFELLKEYNTDTSLHGVEILEINGGDRVNVVPNLCVCTLKGNIEPLYELAELFNESAKSKVEIQQTEIGCILTTKGVAAHGSKPQNGINAVAYMIMFLSMLPLKKNYLSEGVYTIAKEIALQTDGEKLGIACKDNMGELTLNIGYIKTENNVVKVGLDIRFPNATNYNEIITKLKENLKGFDVKTKFELSSHYVPEDSPLVVGLKKAYEEVVGEDAYCISIGGATYARAFENSVAFGALFPGEEGREHQGDEYIDADSLVKLADVLANAIVVLCGDGKHIEKCNR